MVYNIVGKVSRHLNYTCVCACWIHLGDINVFVVSLHRLLVEFGGIGYRMEWYYGNGHGEFIIYHQIDYNNIIWIIFIIYHYWVFIYTW